MLRTVVYVHFSMCDTRRLYLVPGAGAQLHMQVLEDAQLPARETTVQLAPAINSVCSRGVMSLGHHRRCDCVLGDCGMSLRVYAALHCPDQMPTW